VALADLETALERLAAGAVNAAHAVVDWASKSGTDALSPESQALRWHLFHLAARLRGAEHACPDARRWAREMPAQHEVAGDEEQATHLPPVRALESVAYAGVGAADVAPSPQLETVTRTGSCSPFDVGRTNPG
jgi:hypothetical protein